MSSRPTLYSSFKYLSIASTASLRFVAFAMFSNASDVKISELCRLTMIGLAGVSASILFAQMYGRL